MNSFLQDDLRIHYTIDGQGPPILFVHGLGGNADNWLLQRKAFARHNRVIAVDLPGHGRSDGREVPFLAYWKTLLALCDYLAIDRVAVCGLSKGARAALMFAVRHPDRVASVTVINAFAHLTPEDARARHDLYDLLLRTDGGRLWADILLEQMGVTQHDGIVRGFYRSLLAINPQHIWERFNELLSFDQRTELAGVLCPVLLVRGEQDGFVPPYCVAELHDAMPRSTVVRMPDCGHLPYLEQPERFNAILEDFLTSTGQFVGD